MSLRKVIVWRIGDNRQITENTPQWYVFSEKYHKRGTKESRIQNIFLDTRN